ncbi:MAG: hypothetical protein R3192_02805 [Woeseiaceae bacterium]|nr:hypothetical protein [Woeseiaceae bacterium]
MTALKGRIALVTGASRGVVALASGENEADKTGGVLKIGDLGIEYGITDTGGSQPAPFSLESSHCVAPGSCWLTVFAASRIPHKFPINSPRPRPTWPLEYLELLLVPG